MIGGILMEYEEFVEMYQHSQKLRMGLILGRNIQIVLKSVIVIWRLHLNHLLVMTPVG